MKIIKAILISIHPKWVELILNQIKKDEIRKGTAIGKAVNKLIEEQGVAPMLIYCTKQSPWITWYKEVAEINNGQGCVRSYKSLRNSNGKVVARFNATADLLELKMIEGGLYFTTPDRDCFTPNLDLNENAQIDNWQLLHYTGEKLGTKISDIHINDLEIFYEPRELSEFQGTCNRCEAFRLKVCKRNPKKCDKHLTKAPQNYCYVELKE